MKTEIADLMIKVLGALYGKDAYVRVVEIGDFAQVGWHVYVQNNLARAFDDHEMIALRDVLASYRDRVHGQAYDEGYEKGFRDGQATGMIMRGHFGG